MTLNLTDSPLHISVVIPCLNERYQIPALLRVLAEAGRRFAGRYEVCVVDGGSTDGTLEYCQQQSAIKVLQTAPGRAHQLNQGVSQTTGEVIYFIHADTRPPLNCLTEVWQAYQHGHQLGGYSFAFDSQRALFAINNSFTRVNVTATRGGDQSIFCSRELFGRLAGFSESMVVMEEYDLIKRAGRLGIRYKLMEGQTLVSARKYDGRSWVRVQVANIMAMSMWRLGVDSTKIRDRYAKWLKYDLRADEHQH